MTKTIMNLHYANALFMTLGFAVGVKFIFDNIIIQICLFCFVALVNIYGCISLYKLLMRSR